MNIAEERRQAWKKFEPELQVADIILTHDERSLLSSAVRTVTHSYWNHAVLVFSVPNKENLFSNPLLISAENHGIEVHRIQHFTGHFNYIDIGVKRIPGLTQAMKERVISYVLNNVDVPYDYARLFAFVLKYVQDLFIKGNDHLNQFLVNNDVFICSSFIQKAFYSAVPEKRKQSVIFAPDMPELNALEEVTPVEIAKSSACEWLYNPHL